MLRRVQKLKRARAIGTHADPVMLEVFNNLFMSIAEQMGVALQNTAYSVNIKERLDFSCAVFDPTVRSSPTRRTCRCISARWTAPSRPSSARTRARSGPATSTHQRALQRRHAYAGHHRVHAGVRRAQENPVLGGFARPSRRHRRHCARLDVAHRDHDRQEGIYIDNFKLVDRGQFREREMYALLTRAKYPARNPLQNVNDLKAQIAANEKGAQEMRKMVAQFTLPVVHAYMQHVQDNAAESVRRVIDRLHDSSFSLRDGPGQRRSRCRITVDKKKREATVDFTGTRRSSGPISMRPSR